MPTNESIEIDGAALKRLRLMHRLSRTELADRAKMSASNLVRLENQQPTTSLPTLDLLAAVFGEEAVVAIITDPADQVLFLGPQE